MPDNDCISTRILSPRWPVFVAVLMLIAEANSTEPSPVSDTFLVTDKGTALLGPNGEVIERFSSISYAAGSLSPDGKWIAFCESKKGEPGTLPKGNLIIQSRRQPDERTSVPLVWGRSGSSFQPLWTFFSQRILICEQGWNDGVRAWAFRIYDLAKHNVTELNLPIEWWPSDWSIDGKRLLASLDGRVAWVNIDGTGEPEFITSELEIAYGARLPPDGRRILCLAGFRRSGDEGRKLRLSMIDLESKTNQRIIVDEPGETCGHCWSSDGSRIAYTWQRALDQPADVAVRETFLITSDPQGKERKSVTSRKHEANENSFQVFAWR